MSNDGWAQRQRQEWIAETIRIFGFLNREHIQRKFEISAQQASADLSWFQIQHPDAIEYNKSTKRYEAKCPPIT